jgi:uncharacterized membrane-anchored protein YhcB (DUF1043 family)
VRGAAMKNPKTAIAFAIGLAVGMIVYRLIFGG